MTKRTKPRYWISGPMYVKRNSSPLYIQQNPFQTVSVALVRARTYVSGHFRQYCSYQRECKHTAHTTLDISNVLFHNASIYISCIQFLAKESLFLTRNHMITFSLVFMPKHACISAKGFNTPLKHLCTTLTGERDLVVSIAFTGNRQFR